MRQYGNFTYFIITNNSSIACVSFKAKKNLSELSLSDVFFQSTCILQSSLPLIQITKYYSALVTLPLLKTASTSWSGSKDIDGNTCFSNHFLLSISHIFFDNPNSKKLQGVIACSLSLSLSLF